MSKKQFEKRPLSEKKRIDAQFMKIWQMKRNEMHTKDVTARKAKKARIKQIKEMTKNHLFIFVELLQFIHDLEIEWKRINEIWLIEQEKKNTKKKSRLEKSIKEEDDDDDDIEFIINKFDDEEDFISFEDENERNENAKNAKHAKHVRRTITRLSSFQLFEKKKKKNWKIEKLKNQNRKFTILSFDIQSRNVSNQLLLVRILKRNLCKF
jgi:hypothetical protein